MINWKSILSSYHDKPTLLQWLKMVKKALDESVLESASVNNVDETTITLSFNFADGTKITTPSITLPRGLTGAPGKDGAAGAPGKDGVSVTGFDTVSDEVVGNETLTTIRAHFSDGNTDEFVVTATNGKDGSGGGAIKVYKHFVSCAIDPEGKQCYALAYGTSGDPVGETDFTKLLTGVAFIQEEDGADILLGVARNVTPLGSTAFSIELTGSINININLLNDEVTEV